MILQDEISAPTLLHRRPGFLHRPDLTLVSADVENHCSEEVLEDISSDHQPILTKINILRRKHKKRRTRWNFKANWDLFKQKTEESIELDDLQNMNVDTLNDHITSAILNAAKESIPRTVFLKT